MKKYADYFAVLLVSQAVVCVSFKLTNIKMNWKLYCLLNLSFCECFEWWWILISEFWDWIFLKNDKNMIKLIFRWKLKNLWVRLYKTNNWWARKCNIVLKQHLILMIENRTCYLWTKKYDIVLKQHFFLMTKNRIDCLQIKIYRTCYLCVRDRTVSLWTEKYKISYLWTEDRIDYL